MTYIKKDNDKTMTKINRPLAICAVPCDVYTGVNKIFTLIKKILVTLTLKY